MGMQQQYSAEEKGKGLRRVGGRHTEEEKIERDSRRKPVLAWMDISDVKEEGGPYTGLWATQFDKDSHVGLLEQHHSAAPFSSRISRQRKSYDEGWYLHTWAWALGAVGWGRRG